MLNLVQIISTGSRGIPSEDVDPDPIAAENNDREPESHQNHAGDAIGSIFPLFSGSIFRWVRRFLYAIMTSKYYCIALEVEQKKLKTHARGGGEGDSPPLPCDASPPCQTHTQTHTHNRYKTHTHVDPHKVDLGVWSKKTQQKCNAFIVTNPFVRPLRRTTPAPPLPPSLSPAHPRAEQKEAHWTQPGR